ncbi:sugar kinase [Gemmatimonas sp.]|uniref:sugar kinase n=1 Tax=Gemmatimonas sp. TaxID=1962908 RepID=UPI002EDA799D
MSSHVNDRVNDSSNDRVVTFGEVLLRLSPPGNERLFQTPQLRTWWGGAEANVSCGVASLGGHATHVTMLPDNVIGEGALRALRAEGVDTSQVRRAAGRMGAYYLESGADVRALSVVYDRADSAFARQRGDEFDWSSILQDAAWLHCSGVTAALGEGPYWAIERAVDAAAALGVPFSLDLNFRPALWAGRDPKPLMQSLARRASLLIGNPGAIEIMLGISTSGRIPEPASALHATARAIHREYGCARVAITQRDIQSASVHGWQAHLWDSATDALYSAPRVVVQLVDRVGGGDSFAAALLYQLQRGATHAHAVRFATAASALKLTIPGDVNRVSVAEVDRFLTSLP